MLYSMCISTLWIVNGCNNLLHLHLQIIQMETPIKILIDNNNKLSPNLIGLIKVTAAFSMTTAVIKSLSPWISAKWRTISVCRFAFHGAAALTRMPATLVPSFAWLRHGLKLCTGRLKRVAVLSGASVCSGVRKRHAGDHQAISVTKDFAVPYPGDDRLGKT